MQTAEERIAALEATIDELRAELKRVARRESMDRTLTCPACGGGKIVGVKMLFDESGSSLSPLRVIRRAGDWRKDAANVLQAYVCKQCCLVEWRVHGNEGLVADGEYVIDLVRADDAAPKDTTYR
jgi:hypothetical protein